MIPLEAFHAFFLMQLRVSVGVIFAVTSLLHDQQQGALRASEDVQEADYERRRRYHRRMPARISRYPHARVYCQRLSFETLSEELCVKRLRLTKNAIRKLCQLLTGDLDSQSSTATTLTVEMKVTTALNFFANGSFQASTGDLSGLSKSAARACIHQVTDAILRHSSNFINYDMSSEARRDRALQFHAVAGFPKVLGAVDGTHVALRVRDDAPIRYINRKGFHSINVMIICDARLRILAVNTAARGNCHDSTALQDSVAYAVLKALPPNSGWLIGDKGYALRPWLMTPYRNTTNEAQERYNKAHAATRQVVERTIGLPKVRFRCLDRSGGTLQYSHAVVGRIVQACCCLHNCASQEGMALDNDPADQQGGANQDVDCSFCSESLERNDPGAAQCRAARDNLAASTFSRI